MVKEDIMALNYDVFCRQCGHNINNTGHCSVCGYKENSPQVSMSEFDTDKEEIAICVRCKNCDKSGPADKDILCLGQAEETFCYVRGEILLLAEQCNELNTDGKCKNYEPEDTQICKNCYYANESCHRNDYLCEIKFKSLPWWQRIVINKYRVYSQNSCHYFKPISSLVGIT